MWNKIIIDKQSFFIKTYRKNRKWKIVLVNLDKIWIENLSHGEIVDKCQLLNPFLDFEELNLDEIINEMLENILNHVVAESENEIKLEKEIEGGIFKFTINLTKGNLRDLWEEIIKPLSNNAYKLQQQNEVIIEEIKKKDEEISEYRLNGKLLRKNIETRRFDDKLFNNFKVHFEMSNFFSVCNSLVNQNDHPVTENLSKNNENQIKKIEGRKEEKTNANNAIEPINISLNSNTDDNDDLNEALTTSRKRSIQMIDNGSKNTNVKVISTPSKTQQVRFQQKNVTNKKSRKELSNFIL